MELYSGTPSGTHNIYWGNYDCFSIYLSGFHIYATMQYFTLLEFMMIVYDNNLAISFPGVDGSHSYISVNISATNTHQLTFAPYILNSSVYGFVLRGLCKK